MLIQIPKVYIEDTEEKTIDIYINTDLIIKIEPYLNEKQPSIAKSIIAMRDVEPWNWFKSTMSPEEIVKCITNTSSKGFNNIANIYSQYITSSIKTLRTEEYNNENL